MPNRTNRTNRSNRSNRKTQKLQRAGGDKGKGKRMRDGDGWEAAGAAKRQQVELEPGQIEAKNIKFYNIIVEELRKKRKEEEKEEEEGKEGEEWGVDKIIHIKEQLINSGEYRNEEKDIIEILVNKIIQSGHARDEMEEVKTINELINKIAVEEEEPVVEFGQLQFKGGTSWNAWCMFLRGTAYDALIEASQHANAPHSFDIYNAIEGYIAASEGKRGAGFTKPKIEAVWVKTDEGQWTVNKALENVNEGTACGIGFRFFLKMPHIVCVLLICENVGGSDILRILTCGGGYAPSDKSKLVIYNPDNLFDFTMEDFQNYSWAVQAPIYSILPTATVDSVVNKVMLLNKVVQKLTKNLRRTINIVPGAAAGAAAGPAPPAGGVSVYHIKNTVPKELKFEGEVKSKQNFPDGIATGRTYAVMGNILSKIGVDRENCISFSHLFFNYIMRGFLVLTPSVEGDHNLYVDGIRGYGNIVGKEMRRLYARWTGGLSIETKFGISGGGAKKRKNRRKNKRKTKKNKKKTKLRKKKNKKRTRR